MSESITPKDAINSLMDDARKAGREYQKETGCSDERRIQFEIDILVAVISDVWIGIHKDKEQP